MPAKTIFLSHSSKDIEKVRKIRDILESLDYDPLLFHLKCLDDDNDTLEDFIKKEIDARNIFVYCKSAHAEASPWVQKEVAYISSDPSKRLYPIDIERPLSETLVSFLYTLADIIKKNKIFISCSHADKHLSHALSQVLSRHGYEIIKYDFFDPAKYSQHDEDIKSIAQNGIFLPIITRNFLDSRYCISEIEKALYEAETRDVIFKPVFVDISQSVAEGSLPSSAKRYAGYHLSLHDKSGLNELVKFIVEDNKRY